MDDQWLAVFYSIGVRKRRAILWVVVLFCPIAEEVLVLLLLEDLLETVGEFGVEMGAGVSWLLI